MGSAYSVSLPLFPAIDRGGRPTATTASADTFKLQLRAWASELGLPEAFCRRITLHGFRSGGCSDAYNAGMKIEQIMEQGRWTSFAVHAYLHMRHGLVRRALEEVVTFAALTASETDAKRKRQYEMCQRWHNNWDGRRGA